MGREDLTFYETFLFAFFPRGRSRGDTLRNDKGRGIPLRKDKARGDNLRDDNWWRHHVPNDETLFMHVPEICQTTEVREHNRERNACFLKEKKAPLCF